MTNVQLKQPLPKSPRKIYKIFLWISLFLATVSGGIFGWMRWSALRDEQLQKVQFAQSVYDSECSAAPQSVSSVVSRQARLNEASQQLGSIPNWFGLPVDESQVLQSSIAGCQAELALFAGKVQAFQTVLGSFLSFTQDLENIREPEYVSRVQSMELNLSKLSARLKKSDVTPVVEGLQHGARHLQGALEDYRFLLEVANACNINPEVCFEAPRTKELFLHPSSQIVRILVDQYSMEVGSTANPLQRGIKRSDAAGIVLNSATGHIEQAELALRRAEL